MENNGYVIMKKGLFNDVKVWEEDDEIDAQIVLQMLEIDNLGNQYYIRPVTNDEVYQELLRKIEAI